MIYLLIALCVIQSGIFSGLNLALMGITRLQLATEAKAGCPIAAKVLAHRQDSNTLLATILWGNVCVNTLLALLTESAFNGIIGFFVSVILITLVGEILPQAFLSRHLKKVYRILDPLVRLYRFLLYPIAKPTGLLLDRIVGKEGFSFYREQEILHLLEYHTKHGTSEISEIEAKGAINFLSMDDILVTEEGQSLDPKSLVEVQTDDNNQIIFPDITLDPDDPFLQAVHQSNRPWVVLTNKNGSPLLVLDADGFLREVLCEGRIRPFHHCHRPIIVSNPVTTLGYILPRFAISKVHADDDIVDNDIVLYWGEEEKRIITGADLLGKLLQGIAKT